MDMQNSMYRESLQTRISSVDLDLPETSLIKNIDLVINNWVGMQKILKEGQNLEKIIEKQHLDVFDQIKKYIQDYYKLNIKSRKLYEDIKFLKLGSEWIIAEKEGEDEKFFVKESSGDYFGNAVVKIKNIMSIIRENYDYIPKIVSLIDENDSKQEIESLAEFFCNQFYTNIFIPNPEQEELLICIYKLLEQEINKMEIADIDNFLDDSTFIGKFMTAFSKKQELNSFLANLLGKIFFEVDKRNDYNLMDLSINKMLKFIKQEKQDKNEEFKQLNLTSIYTEIRKNIEKKEELKGINPIEKILEKIPKTKINFKKQFILEEEIFRDSQISVIELSNFYNDDFEFEFDFDENKQNEKIDFNSNYFENLTEEKLSERLKYFSDPDLISFYENLINQLKENYHDPDAFGNSEFLLTLKDNYFFDEKEILAAMYLKNFLFIQKQVEEIIQSLIDKIATIPYSVKCICIIIDKLIQNKFPKLPKYFRHSYIGKFLFNKCIFPMLNLENTNGLKNSIFTRSQRNCLKCIISVLSNANNCKLFDIYNDVEKTMFNYYLLEIIPILNSFYDKLVDMQLPNFIAELLEESKYNNKNIEYNFLFNYEEKKNKKEINTKKIKPKYNYFKENADEIIRIKSVCFNEIDILFIIKLINRNFYLFEGLPEFNRIKLALKERDMNIKELEKIIRNKKKKNNKGEGYYTLIFNEQNPNFKYKLKDFYKETKTEKEKTEEKTLLSRMKNSIKFILRRLNLLNIKEYPYLNFATSNEKFFQAINYTLKDFEDEEDLGVPLSWHSKFIINNKNQLDIKYSKNDFDKLYEEIFIEENEHVNNLKTFSPIISTREEMNINCAENLITNMKFYTKNLEKAKKSEKVKIFVIQDKTEICISFKENKEKKENDIIKYSKTFNYTNNKYSQNNKLFIIEARTVDKCDHLGDKFLYGASGLKNISIDSHVKSVGEFVNKLIRAKGRVNQIIEYIKEDIKTGDTEHKIYDFFYQYKQILKNSLLKNYNELIEDKNDADEIIDKIEDYILRKIYKYVFPIDQLEKDMSFYAFTISYDWVQASDFGAKGDIPLEAIQDGIFYLKQMEERANSVSEKLKCLQMVYKNINQITEFYFGKLDMSAEAQTPIFNYIIIKAHPKRFASNIYYLNCFTKDNLFVRNCFASIDFICGLTPFNFGINTEEFNKRCIQSSNKFTF